jgi:hypothetical protein
MSGTWHWYGTAIEKVAEGSIDLDTDTFKLMLATSGYTPDQDAHDFRNDVTPEVADSGTYTAGGATLAGGTFAYDAGSNEYRIAWTSPVSFTGATITARTAVIYKSRGGASSADELLAYCTESGDVSSTAGTFSINLPSPTLKITVA